MTIKVAISMASAHPSDSNRAQVVDRIVTFERPDITEFVNQVREAGLFLNDAMTDWVPASAIERIWSE